MIGQKINFIDCLDSTNNYIAKLIKANEIVNGTVIIAGSQTQGKGQRGAIWEAEPNKNILLSFYLTHDNLTVNEQFNINFYVSISIIDFLAKYNIKAQIKWPNDIVIENKKIAGILIENSFENSQIKHSVVGIGLNVNQRNFGNYNATSLALLKKEDLDLQNAVFELIYSFNSYINLLQTKNYNALKNKYLEHLWLLNNQSTFKNLSDEFEAMITGISDEGELILRENGKEIKYKNKEIEFLERKKRN
jgi:BirA family transcriptional regulator, biotin operon repressor / biotin---[acetyl-CoA-carboxylase] ligase